MSQIVTRSLLVVAIIAAGQSSARPDDGEAPQPPRISGQERLIFDNGNKGAVANGAHAPTRFSLVQPCFITYVETYHWNNGRGKAPGTISLRHQDGALYGPWSASGKAGQGGVANAYWFVRPNVNLRPGVYTVIDSDPGTWAHNQQSQGRGFAQVKGIFRGDDEISVVSVPNVVGISHQAAHARVAGYGLVLKHPGEPPPDTLVRTQAPAPGTRVKRGSAVTVTFTLAVTVPDLKGLAHDAAHKQVESLGLVLQHPGEPTGKAKVVRQNPPPGSKVNQGSAVAVIFQDSVVVPYLRGLTHAAAHQQVEKLGLSLAHGAEPGDKEAVKTQDPAAGTEVAHGAAVRVTFAPLTEIIAEDLAKADAKSGDVQISLHWTNKSDLDLHVVCPSGETIMFSHRRSQCGGELDVDRNAQYANATSSAVENVYWPKGKAPAGKYRVFVDFYSNHGKQPGCADPSAFTVRVVVQGTAKIFQGTVGSQVNRKVLVHEFDLAPGGDIAIAKIKPAPPTPGTAARANFGYRGNVVILGNVVPELTAELQLAIVGNTLTGTLNAPAICETNRRIFGGYATLTATLPPGAQWEGPGPITGGITGDIVGCPQRTPIKAGSTFTLTMKGRTIFLTTTGLYYNNYQFGAPMGQVITVPGGGGGAGGAAGSGMLVDLSNTSREIQDAFSHVPKEVVYRSSGVVIVQVGETHHYTIQAPGAVRDANGIPSTSFTVIDTSPPSVDGPGIVNLRVSGSDQLEVTGKAPGYGQVSFRQTYRVRFSDGSTNSVTATGHFFIVVKTAAPEPAAEKGLPKVTIRGRAIRRDNHKPVAGAMLQLIGDRGKGAGYPRQLGRWKTDANGEFTIEAIDLVPEGQYELFLLRFNPDPGAVKIKEAYEQDLWPVKFYLMNITKEGAARGPYDVGTIVMDTVENLWGSFLKKTSGTGRHGIEWRGAGPPPQEESLLGPRRGGSRFDAPPAVARRFGRAALP